MIGTSDGAQFADDYSFHAAQAGANQQVAQGPVTLDAPGVPDDWIKGINLDHPTYKGQKPESLVPDGYQGSIPKDYPNQLWIHPLNGDGQSVPTSEHRVPGNVVAADDSGIMGDYAALGTPAEEYNKAGENKVTEQVAGAGKAMAAPFVNFAKQAHDAMLDPKNYDPSKSVSASADLAMTLAGAGSATAPLREAGVGVFGGRIGAEAAGNQAAHAAMDEAEALLKAGHNPSDVWQATGALRGPDGKMRFEIGDDAAKLNTGMMHKDYSGKVSFDRKEAYHLEDVLDHPELYKHYPELKKWTVQGHYDNPDEKGYFLQSQKLIGLSEASPDRMKSTLMHEIQHYVQNKEGYAQGASPSIMRDVILKHDRMPSHGVVPDDVAEIEYRRAFGEFEAREVQDRMRMNAAQRQMNYPYDSMHYKSTYGEGGSPQEHHLLRDKAPIPKSEYDPANFT